MEPSKIYYDHTLISDKHFFGGYLNLAQNNIDLVLNAYAERFSLPKNDYIIQNSLGDKLSDSDYRNRIAYLAKYFPLIYYIGDKENKQDRSVLRKNFDLLLDGIKNLRNFYTHFFHKPISIDNDLYTLLESILLQVVKDVRKNRLKADKTRLLLKKGLKDELQILFNAKKEKLKQDKEKGKKVNLDNESIQNGVLNDAFRHLIYKAKNGNDALCYRYQSKYNDKESIPENGIAISQSGLIFFLSLFLGKKENEDMRARIKGFKGKLINTESPDFPNRDSSSLKYMATHWVFSYLSFKGLKHQLSSTFDKETLLIQIIDELSKVPDAVYNALPQERRDSFIEDINEYIKEENETHSLQESIVVHPVIRKRYENKFNYFVIRFLDEFVNFPTLRFQIHAGNYVHDRRIKNIDGTTYETDRVIKEKINVFGKLSEITKLKAEHLIQKDKEEILGWEIYPNPSYNIDSNNIPIYLKSGIIDEVKKYRTLRNTNEGRKRRTEKEPKYSITSSIGKKELVNFDEPTALLSMNEIPALLYELLINKKTPEEIEKCLNDKLTDRFDIIKNYTPDQNLSISQIPKKLKKSTNQAIINIDKLTEAINNELKITRDKLELININRAETKQIERGKPKRKYVFKNKELGEEATWIADDLIRFMPKDSRDKWKGYNHSQLQESIAYYNNRPQEAYELLLPFWSFENETYLWNEGIKKAFRTSKSFDVFYEKYLTNRNIIFTNIKECILNNHSNKKILDKALKQQNVWTLFNERLYRIDTTESQKEKLLAKPFVFPRGIFDPKPTFIKGLNIKDNVELFADWYRYAYDEKHKFQQFYDFERDYTELFEEEKNKENPKQTIEKLKISHDLYVKGLKTQDLYLKLIAEQLYQKVFEHSVEMSLSDFYLTQKERLAKNTTAREQSKRQEGDNSDNVINDRFIWSKTVPFFSGQIEEPAVKLKDIGKFKRLISDSKVQHILSYDKQRKWNKLELENELTSYEDIRREKLLKEIHLLERQILENNGFDGKNHIKDFEQKENPNFKHYIVKGVLEKKSLANESDREWLLNIGEGGDHKFEDISVTDLKMKSESIQKAFLLIFIRNKIGHNQLLTADIFHYLLEICDVKAEENQTYAELILKCTQKLILDIK